MISFDVDGFRFNYRVSGIFVDSKNEKFLTNTVRGLDFIVLPGGRVELGEDSADALKREMMEELGKEIEIVSLKVLSESFFEFEGRNYHEIQFIYVAKFKDNELEKYDDVFNGLEEKDVYKWYRIDEFDNLPYRPSHLKQVIKEAMLGNNTFVHDIHKGNG